MIFWVGILIGGLFTWLAVKMGFYETWAFVFNIVISIYVAVFLAPVILELFPAAGETSYANALALIVTAVGTFSILHAITYILFTSQFRIALPKIFDLLLAGLLGFLAGFLVSSFAAITITAMPISQNQFMSEIGFNRESQQANISYISWWCDLVNTVVSSSDNTKTSKQVIDRMLIGTESGAHNNTLERIDPNEPAKSSDMKTDRPGEKRIPPP